MFSDVQNHWAKSSILELAERNLVRGYPDGTFRPNAGLTRAEFAVLMFNCFSKAPIVRPSIKFKDVSENHWAFRAIEKATSRGFLVGYPDQTFKPDEQITRVQTIIAYASYLKLKVPQEPAINGDFSTENILQVYFEDAPDIPNYAKRLMLAAAHHYFVVNHPNRQKLNPNKPSTRGEVAALICQALKFWGVVPIEHIAIAEPLAIFPQYSSISSFNEGLAIVNSSLRASNFYPGWTVIDKKGQVVLNTRSLDWTGQQFSEGLLRVSLNGKLGFINQSGTFVIPATLEFSDDFSEGFAGVKIDKKFGYINRAGTAVISPQFDSVGPFKGGIAPVSLNQKYGYINALGEVIVPIEYEFAINFYEGMAIVKKGGKYGFVDAQGNEAIAPQFESCKSFSDGLAQVRLENRYGFIDKTGELVIQTPYSVESFSEGLAAILVDDKWGYIDRTGQIVISPLFYGLEYMKPWFYPAAQPFSEGLAAVRVGKNCGFIDADGNWMIRPKFSDARSFSEGLAPVSWDGEWITRPIGFDGSANPVDFETTLEGAKWGYVNNPLR